MTGHAGPARRLCAVTADGCSWQRATTPGRTPRRGPRGSSPRWRRARVDRGAHRPIAARTGRSPLGDAAAFPSPPQGPAAASRVPWPPVAHRAPLRPAPPRMRPVPPLKGQRLPTRSRCSRSPPAAPRDQQGVGGIGSLLTSVWGRGGAEGIVWDRTKSKLQGASWLEGNACGRDFPCRRWSPSQGSRAWVEASTVARKTRVSLWEGQPITSLPKAAVSPLGRRGVPLGGRGAPPGAHC